MPKIYGSSEIWGDLLVTGSFSILGSSATIDTTSLVVSDSIIALGHSQSGTPVLDEGIMFVRGTGLTQAFIWDESDDTFALIGTNDDHTVVGDVNITSYSNLRVGGLTTSSLRLIGGTSGYYLQSDLQGNANWSQLPGGLTGSGSTNYIPYWTNSNTLSSTSSIYISGDNVGIKTTSPQATLDVRGSAVFNESGEDFDFRIEGDTDTNLFFVDASSDNIGIGITPNSTRKIQLFTDTKDVTTYVVNQKNASFTYGLFTWNASIGSNPVAIYGQSTNGTGDVVGVQGLANSLISTRNVGGYFDSLGATSYNIGIYGIARGSVGYNQSGRFQLGTSGSDLPYNMGVYVDISSGFNSSVNLYGYYSRILGSSSVKYGDYVEVSGNGFSDTNYGSYVNISGGSVVNYGDYTQVSGTFGSSKYGNYLSISDGNGINTQNFGIRADVNGGWANRGASVLLGGVSSVNEDTGFFSFLSSSLSSSQSTSYGAYFWNNSTKDSKYGSYHRVDGNNLSTFNYGIDSLISGANSVNTGIRTRVTGTYGTTNQGIVSTVDSTGQSTIYGMQSAVQTSNTTQAYGIYSSVYGGTNLNVSLLAGVGSFFSTITADIAGRFFISNQMGSTFVANSDSYGITVDNNSLNTGSKYGISNTLSSGSASSLRGINQNITTNTNSITTYGIFNQIFGTAGFVYSHYSNINGGISSFQGFGQANFISDFAQSYGVYNSLSGATYGFVKYGVFTTITGTGSNYGEYIQISATGSNNYGIYIDSYSASNNFGVVVNRGTSIFNESGEDYDFRVEGATDSNLLFIDASTDNIGIGNNTPSYKLQVLGTVSTTGFRMTNGASNGFVLASDSDGVGSWTALAGRLGIANTSGVYTFYNDFTSAMAAAVAGQTIEMFADISTGSNVSINLKNGVNINGNGHSYFYSNSLGNCFKDNGAAVTCSILNLTISRTSSLSSGANVLLTGSSRIDFTGSYIYRDVLTDNYACIEIQGAARVFNAYCLNEYGRGIWSTNANSLIENCFGQTIQNSGYGIMSHGNVVKSTGIAVDLQGIFITTTTGTAINCIGISTSSQGIRGNTTNSTGISTSGNGIGATSVSTHRNSTGISSSGGALSTGAVVATCHNCTFETNTGTFGASSDNGQYYNCSISVLSGTGNGVVSPLRVLNCSVRVASNSANCITSSAAKTVNYASNVWIGTTTPVNALITQGTINIEDAQGNILM
jgi:hypothetical protein